MGTYLLKRWGNRAASPHFHGATVAVHPERHRRSGTECVGSGHATSAVLPDANGSSLIRETIPYGCVPPAPSTGQGYTCAWHRDVACRYGRSASISAGRERFGSIAALPTRITSVRSMARYRVRITGGRISWHRPSGPRIASMLRRIILFGTVCRRNAGAEGDRLVAPRKVRR